MGFLLYLSWVVGSLGLFLAVMRGFPGYGSLLRSTSVPGALSGVGRTWSEREVNLLYGAEGSVVIFFGSSFSFPSMGVGTLCFSWFTSAVLWSSLGFVRSRSVLVFGSGPASFATSSDIVCRSRSSRFPADTVFFFVRFSGLCVFSFACLCEGMLSFVSFGRGCSIVFFVAPYLYEVFKAPCVLSVSWSGGVLLVFGPITLLVLFFVSGLSFVSFGHGDAVSKTDPGSVTLWWLYLTNFGGES